MLFFWNRKKGHNCGKVTAVKINKGNISEFCIVQRIIGKKIQDAREIPGHMKGMKVKYSNFPSLSL